MTSPKTFLPRTTTNQFLLPLQATAPKQTAATSAQQRQPPPINPHRLWQMNAHPAPTSPTCSILSAPATRSPRSRHSITRLTPSLFRCKPYNSTIPKTYAKLANWIGLQLAFNPNWIGLAIGWPEVQIFIIAPGACWNSFRLTVCLGPRNQKLRSKQPRVHRTDALIFCSRRHYQ